MEGLWTYGTYSIPSGAPITVSIGENNPYLVTLIFSGTLDCWFKVTNSIPSGAPISELMGINWVEQSRWNIHENMLKNSILQAFSMPDERYLWETMDSRQRLEWRWLVAIVTWHTLHTRDNGICARTNCCSWDSTQGPQRQAVSLREPDYLEYLGLCKRSLIIVTGLYTWI